VVVFRKQNIIGVDDVDNVEAYNNYDEMPLLIDFCKKIEIVEKNLSKDILPWKRKCVKGKVIMAS
jgi:phage anti-repressor protein